MNTLRKEWVLAGGFEQELWASQSLIFFEDIWRSDKLRAEYVKQPRGRWIRIEDWHKGKHR